MTAGPFRKMRADLARLNAEPLAELVELASATASPRQRTKAFQVIETAHDGLGFAHRGRLRVIKAGKSVIVRPEVAVMDGGCDQTSMRGRSKPNATRQV